MQVAADYRPQFIKSWVIGLCNLMGVVEEMICIVKVQKVLMADLSAKFK